MRDTKFVHARRTYYLLWQTQYIYMRSIFTTCGKTRKYKKETHQHEISILGPTEERFRNFSRRLLFILALVNTCACNSALSNKLGQPLTIELGGTVRIHTSMRQRLLTQVPCARRSERPWLEPKSHPRPSSVVRSTPAVTSQREKAESVRQLSYIYSVGGSTLPSSTNKTYK